MWFNLRKQHGLTEPLLTPPQWDGKKISKVKVRKLIGQDKDSLKAKVRVLHTGKTKQGINSAHPIGRQVFRHSQASRAPSGKVATWEEKYHPSKHPFYSFHFFSNLYMLSTMPYGKEYPVDQLGSAILALMLYKH